MYRDARFEKMVQSAREGGHLWTLHCNEAGVYAISCSEVPPARDDLIAGAMVIEHVDVRWNEVKGRYVEGAPYRLTMAQARAFVCGEPNWRQAVEPEHQRGAA